MSPPSKFLPLSSLPRSTSHIDPALTQGQSPPQITPPPPLPSSQDNPSFSTAPEEPFQPTAILPTSSPKPSVSAEEEAEEEEEEGGEEVPEEALQSNIPPPPLPPNFAPFFSLLSSSSHPDSEREKSTTTYHPAVQYIFADDPPDTSPIVDAALDMLDSASAGEHGSTQGGPDDATGEEVTAASGSGGTRERNERYILLDMDESGTKVKSAKSMSPEWAVTGAEMSMAPTWDGDGGGGVGSEAGRGGGWMLRVDGIEALSGAVRGEKGSHGKEQEKGLEELVLEYERRIGELRQVVGLGTA